VDKYKGSLFFLLNDVQKGKDQQKYSVYALFTHYIF